MLTRTKSIIKKGAKFPPLSYIYKSFQIIRGCRRSSYDAAFEPYVKKLDIDGIEARFLFATAQARDWYDPIKPYAKLEYEWVIRNVTLNGQNVLDGGAHHGQYSVVLALGATQGCYLISVDPFPMNCSLTEVNLCLNGKKPRIEKCALSDKNGDVHFERKSNGKIITDGGGMLVASRTIQSLLPNANVVKLDVEGAEYSILPSAIDELDNVHTYILEIHPHGNPHPDTLIEPLIARDYEIYYVNREKNIVEPYKLGTYWNIHSTIFARRQKT